MEAHQHPFTEDIERQEEHKLIVSNGDNWGVGWSGGGDSFGEEF